MRRSALAVAFVVFVAMLAALAVSTSAAPLVSAAPGDGANGGTLNAWDEAKGVAITPQPTSYDTGSSARLQANFASGTSGSTITLYKEGPADTWTAVESHPANSNGNAYYDYPVTSGSQRLYAETAGGLETEIDTITGNAPVPVGPTGPDVGNLYENPTTFAEGDTITLTANFPSGSFSITLYKETAPDVWSPVATKSSNSSGNADFSYKVSGSQKLFARKANNDRTEVDTLTPTVIDPVNFTQTGVLTTSPTKIYDGRKGTVVADFPNGTVGVTLFKETAPGVWTGIGQATSDSSGKASFTGVTFDGTQTLFALTSTGQRTDVRTIVPAPPSDVTGGPSNLGTNRVYVTTDSGSTPTTKGVDYKGKAVLASGATLSNTLDLDTIAVRGNSTADKDKKPYKLKFEDKQKPFGMKSDKTWILLANYGDWTLIRSMVAWDLGKMVDGLKWTPDSRFAELFLNGKYLGSYQLVQSIKIDSNRVNVSKTTGQVIEFDPHWKEDGVPGFVGASGMNYAWKDPDEFKTLDGGGSDPEGLTNAKIDAMKIKIRNFEKVLYGTDGKKDWSKVHYSTLVPQADWMTYLDLNSAVDYYLTREFTKDNDADFYRSNFFYTNNVDPASPDKFFMGPIWDFDRSAGAKPAGDTTVSSPTGWWIRGNGSPNHDTNTIHWFTRIAKDPRFLKALHDRWAAKKTAFDAVSPGGVDAAVKALGGSDDLALGQQVAANDRARWAGHGGRYAPKTSSYSGEINWVKNWYAARYAWMDAELIKTPPPIPD